MIVWLLPAALVGLAALAGPVLVHLLRRQRARTVVIPTVRFVPVVDQSVVRIRRPADLLLLFVRMSIVACAALALARPLFLTNARAASWADRIARVAVVDTTNPAIAALANDAAIAELTAATFSQRIDTIHIESAIRQGSAWLNAAPPGRRELVVISDFRLGAIDEALVRDVPASAGVRFIPVRAKAEVSREITVPDSLGADAVFTGSVRIEAATTSATFSRRPRSIDGLTLPLAPEDETEGSKLLRIVGRAGAHAPSASQPVIVRFAGGPPLGRQVTPAPGGWARGAALRLSQRADAADLPLTAGVGDDGALLVDVNARPGTLTAAEALKAALDSRPDPRQIVGQEIAYIPTERLEALRRPAPPADLSAWQRSDHSDARWFWLASLALLGAEGWLRRGRSTPAAASEVNAHAA